MKIRDRVQELRRVRAGDLVPNPKNWRTHPKTQADALKGILAEVGYADALLARELPDGTLMLVDGHLRAETTPEQEVPVLVLDINEAEADKLLLSLDPLAALAETNAVALDALLREVDTGSPELQQMYADLADAADLYKDDPKEVVEDEVPEPPADPITKAGDLWMLGDHRLLCGDSTKAEDVERLMAGAKGRLIATDPPYGVDFSGARYCPTAKKWEGIANDKRQGDDLCEWLTSMWSTWLKWVEDDSSFYSWCAAMEEGAAAAAAAMRKAGIHVQSQIIWVKNALVLGQADYQWKHENCWYGFLKGKQHRWFGERDKTTVWEIKKVSSSQYVHPMQKPVDLYATSMQHHTLKGDIVCEPFSGSGTQFIAAEQLGRKCYGMEISPAYCDVIVKRWETLTGKKAELEVTNGKERTTQAANSGAAPKRRSVKAGS